MEWLNPWALWLTTTLAFPLWLHFRQRSRPKEAPFPSLMLLRKGFPQAMQRKKLRDLLQLILRLLILLCLVMALAQPRWREATAWPSRGLMLIDNTVTGMLPDATHGTRLSAQWRESQNLDSRFPAGLQRLPILQDADIVQGEARFGDIALSLRRLLPVHEEQLGEDSDPGEKQGEVLILPVLPGLFDEQLAISLRDWLLTNPQHRLLIWKQGSARPPSQWPQITQAEIAAGKQPTVTGASQLRITANQDEADLAHGLLNWQNGYEKQIAGKQGTWQIALNNESGGWNKGNRPENRLGTFRLAIAPEWDGAWNRFHFILTQSATGRIVHAGDSWASLPSLSLPEGRLAVEHWPAGMRLPELVTRGPKAVAAVMLAGRLPASEDLERLAAFVLDGGGLILSLGNTTDITALNSRILAPLGLGRITGSITHAKPKAVKVVAAGYAKLNLDPALLGGRGGVGGDGGGAGEVMRHFSQEPSPGADTLLVLSEPNGDQPIAVHRKAGHGHLLLWNTSVDSLNWSTLGLQPLLPLTHQALLKALRSQKQPVTLASDSIWVWPTTDPKAEVIGPDGALFSRIRPSVEGLHLGPFDKVGFYTCRSAEETTTVVVNLIEPWLRTPIPTTTSEVTADESELVKSLGSAANQMTLTDSPPSIILQSRSGTTWPIWLGIAVLLLLLDGLVALIYATPKPLGRAS